MCNEAGDISKISLVSQDLYELNKELLETREQIRTLHNQLREAAGQPENERTEALRGWVVYLEEKTVRLQAEIAGHSAAD